jgi:phage shock protein B
VEDALTAMVVLGILFVAFPAIVLNYMTQWRKAKGISIEDENLLDDLHDTARRLDARLESIERIIAADNPGWKDGALPRPADRPADRLTDAGEPRLATRR